MLECIVSGTVLLMSSNLSDVRIPENLLPSDGRFGAGPSKVRRQQVDKVSQLYQEVLGTSHRQEPVKTLVGSIREGFKDLYALPDSWEVVIGNGGASLFWDAATFGLIRKRSEHLVFGEFSSKFASIVAQCPHLESPLVVQTDPGQVPTCVPANVDAYCFTHNETSTGAIATLERPKTPEDAIVIVDATSAAGSMALPLDAVDVYYFSLQKGFGSDGGTWVALCSERALERLQAIHMEKRWTPASLDLHLALINSRSNQTYNTPSLATLIMLNEQLRWMLANGGLAWCISRVSESSKTLYSWAQSNANTTPYIANPVNRSPVVGTIDLTGVDAVTVSQILRLNGIVDVDSYRKLERNQLRVSMFPSVEPTDVEKLTKCIDYVIGEIL